jgi:hypothetical protein
MWRALSPRAHAHHLKSKKKLSHETPAPSQTLNLSTRHARKKRITCNSTGGSASGKEGLHGEGGGPTPSLLRGVRGGGDATLMGISTGWGIAGSTERRRR